MKIKNAGKDLPKEERKQLRKSLRTKSRVKSKLARHKKLKKRLNKKRSAKFTEEPILLEKDVQKRSYLIKRLNRVTLQKDEGAARGSERPISITNGKKIGISKKELAELNKEQATTIRMAA